MMIDKDKFEKEAKDVFDNKVKPQIDRAKQTAVEFAFEELNKWRIENFGEDALIGIPQEVLDKAKQMEREQIEEAHGNKQKTKSNPDSLVTYGYTYTGEMYYNETYSK